MDMMDVDLPPLTNNKDDAQTKVSTYEAQNLQH